MSNMSVKVEFLAGTDFTTAVSEAHYKSVAWDVAYVCFDFNGVKVSVGQNVSNLNKAHEDYLKQQRTTSEHKFLILNS